MSSRKDEDLVEKVIEKECQNTQRMIDVTAKQLQTLRVVKTTDNYIKTEIKENEGKLIKYFSKQLVSLAKLDNVPERLKHYPDHELWLKIVGINSQTIQGIKSKCHGMNKMLELSEKDILKLMQSIPAIEDDTIKLNIALKNLKFCTEQLHGGHITDIDLSWSNKTEDVNGSGHFLRTLHNRPSTSSLPPECFFTSTSSPPTPPESNPTSPLPYTHSSSPPPTPPQVKASNQQSKGKFPTTPPPRKKNELHPFPGNLIKSKSHESQLGNRVNADKGSPSVDLSKYKYIKKKPEGLNIGSSCETLPSQQHRKVSGEGLVSGQSSPLPVSSPKRSPPFKHVDQGSLSDMDDVHPNKRNQLQVHPVSPRSMMHSINHSKRHRYSQVLITNRQHKFGHMFKFTSCDFCQRQMLLGYRCKGCNFQTLIRLTSIPCDFCQKQVWLIREVCRKCKFQKHFVVGACDLCHKHVFRGKVCKYCKQKFHRDCAAKAAPACGLPNELVDIFIETLKRDGSPSSVRRLNESMSLPYGDSPVVRASSVPAFQPHDSGSTTSSCTSSTPSSPAPFNNLCNTPSSSSAQPSPAIVINDHVLTQAHHTQFHFPDVSTDTSSHYTDSINSLGSIGIASHYVINSNPDENTVDVINTNTSNDSDKSDKTLVDTGSSSDKGNVPLLERVDSFEEEALCQRWNRVNSISVTLKEWDIPYDNIKFQEKDKVGEGRFGTVYKGNWHGEVAIKKLKMDPDLDNQAQLQAFKLEIAMLRKTRHENLVLFMGACMKPPNLAIVTSFCQGKTLYTVIHDDKEKFNMGRAVIIASQISQGMGYLHEKSIIHKDLKSKNVFLESGKVVITDFGLFNVTKLCYGSRKADYLFIPPGWLCYLAPEIMRSLSPYSQTELPFSKASDIYAFGTVWYEILSGFYPFTKVHPETIIWQVGKGMKQSLTHVQASKDVKELLLKCWCYNPNERPTYPELMMYLDKLPKKRLIRSPSHPVNLSRSAESVF